MPVLTCALHSCTVTYMNTTTATAGMDYFDFQGILTDQGHDPDHVETAVRQLEMDGWLKYAEDDERPFRLSHVEMVAAEAMALASAEAWIEDNPA